jgi:hypothetical protein
MDNHHIESDIAMLYMQIETEEGDARAIYDEIRGYFDQLRAGGDDVPSEFAELERELEMRFAA